MSKAGVGILFLGIPSSGKRKAAFPFVLCIHGSGSSCLSCFAACSSLFPKGERVQSQAVLAGRAGTAPEEGGDVCVRENGGVTELLESVSSLQQI